MLLAGSDYTFPKLGWEQALKVAHELGVAAIDVGLFADRSHLVVNTVFADCARAAGRVCQALRSNGMQIADVFGQAAPSFEECALNHPDIAVRQTAADFFHHLLEFALRSNGSHLTLLPGAKFPNEAEEDSLRRTADELAWRVEEAGKLGVTLGIEAHLGSIVPTPMAATRLLDMTPGLTLTLDYTHFTYQGFADSAIEPLLARTSHFHARGACPGKLQSTMAESTIDYSNVVKAMHRTGYRGFVALEYVWTEWMDCNRVDNLSETIILRDILQAAGVDASPHHREA